MHKFHEVHKIEHLGGTPYYFVSIPDPYAAVSFGTQSQLSEVMKKTLSPMWDQTLIFDELTLYGPPENVAQNPPECVIEIFDQDFIVSYI